MGTKNNPGKFDCYNAALPDEPMFVLLGRDPSAPALVIEWSLKRLDEVNLGNRPESDRRMVEGGKGHEPFSASSGYQRMLEAAIASPPPPSVLREALEEARARLLHLLSIFAHPGFTDRGNDAEGIRATLLSIRRALASPLEPAPAKAGDGWVKVDESHPLPDDLTWGDETLEHHAYCKSPKVIAYRRRPSTEQGG